MGLEKKQAFSTKTDFEQAGPTNSDERHADDQDKDDGVVICVCLYIALLHISDLRNSEARSLLAEFSQFGRC